MSDAFFHPDGDSFIPAEYCRGPWDPEAQHAGPPAALLGRALERLGVAGSQIARVTFEILRPVPLRRLQVEAGVLRPGRSVQLLGGRLTADGQELVRATAWSIRTEELALPDAAAGQSPPPGPQAGAVKPFFPTGMAVGYHTAMEARFVKGGFVDPGPATTWMRMRHPLLADEEPSPLTRVLIAADSGNGVSAALDYTSWVFINTDLTVYLHRLPRGEWVCLDAVTVPEPNGIGLTHTRLFDETGAIGYGLQALFIAPAGGANS